MRALTMLQAQWTADMQTGESLTFSACKGGFFSSDREFALRISGRTTQNVLSGKNRLDPDAKLDNRLLSWADGTVVYEGKSVVSDYIPISPGATYTCSHAAQWCVYDAAKTYLGAIKVDGTLATSTGYSGKTATVPAGNAAYLRLGIRSVYNDGENMTDVTDMQLELGDTATAFEPYCGGIPAPSQAYPQPICCTKAGTVVQCRGKNLWNFAESTPSVEGVTFTPCRDGVVINGCASAVFSYGICDLTDKLVVGTTYVCSVADGPVTGIEPYFVIRTAVGASYKRAFTHTSDVERVLVYIAGTAGVSFDQVLLKPQAEVGSIATAYEPYFAPIAFSVPRDLYEDDVWYPQTGIVERHNAVITSYAGETLPTTYTSTTGGAHTGSTIVYPLTTPIEEHYAAVAVFAPTGTVLVEQTPLEARGTLSATMAVRRA